MRKLLLLPLVILFQFVQVNAAEKCLLDLEKIPKTLVYDQVDLLTDQEEQSLKNKLIEFDRKTSNQILIVIVENLCGLDPAGFTYEIGQKWGVGSKDFNNGIVIMVKPTGGSNQRKTFIATGYGLEGRIPDATAKQIVNKELIPNFKNKKFFKGLDEATTVLMALAEQEFSHNDYNKKKSKKKSPIFPILFILFFVGVVLFARISTVRTYARNNDLAFWTAFWLISNSRHKRGGGWNDFNSGGGNFGGFGGGGGFGGFGGGSFGGGGAGGSW